MNPIKTEFQKGNFDYDKSVNVVDVLPYKSEFYIQPNELSYHKAFILKLSHLYDNFIYLYSRCSIPNFSVPSHFNGFIGVSGNALGIYQDTTTSKPFSASNFPDLDFAKNAVVYNNNGLFYFFVNCLSSINVVRYDENLNFCQICPNKITNVNPISGDLTFKKINSISILDNKFLCVSDEILDTVFKYDLETYFLNENIFKGSVYPFGNKLFLLDSIGAQGDIS